jgi:hypothetical protein
MNSLVLGKVRFCAEDFKTLIAFIDFYSTMASLLLFKRKM